MSYLDSAMDTELDLSGVSGEGACLWDFYLRTTGASRAVYTSFFLFLFFFF